MAEMKQKVPTHQANGERHLPEGWVWTTLGEISEINFRDPLIRGLPDDFLVTFLPMAAVDADQGSIEDPQIRPLGQVKKGYTSFSESDVLFAKITPSMENGKAAIAKDLTNGLGFGSTEFHVLTPKDGIQPTYIFYFIRQKDFRREAKANFAGTAGQLRVPTSFLVNYPFPLAPLPEQQRIVAEIETQFTRLDAGVAALKRMQANLKRYKASVLKAACEGRLVPTEAELAQVEGRDYEPAEVLLERILDERRAKWEEQEWQKLIEKAQKKVAQARRKAAGRPARIRDLDPSEWQALPEADYARYLPKNDKWKEKYKEPSAPDTSDLPELPEGWVWGTVEQVSDRIVDCLHSTPRFADSGFLCVDTNCIVPGRIILERARFVDEETFHERNRRMVPQTEDVIFSREGALLGIAVRVPENLDFCLGQRMMIFRMPTGVDSKYYEILLNSFVFRVQYLKEITGTASPHLNIRDIRQFAVPLPPIVEQHRIVDEVERRLSVVAELEATIEASLKRAERLRQAILKRAFEGKLVPQDSEDEPARVLLERISEDKITR